MTGNDIETDLGLGDPKGKTNTHTVNYLSSHVTSKNCMQQVIICIAGKIRDDFVKCHLWACTIGMLWTR